MHRRHFIQNTLALGAGAIFLPEVFSSCKKNTLHGTYHGKVIIIGAGIAGLHTAKLLSERGAEVVILEASNQIGGRIRSHNNGWASYPIELGAEEIHGKKSVWYDMVKQSGATFLNNSTDDFITYQNTIHPQTSLSGNVDFQKASQFLSTAANHWGDDLSVSSLANSHQISSSFYHLTEARLGNEYGTSNIYLNARGITAEYQLWSSGNSNYLPKNKAYSDVLDEHYSSLYSLVKKQHAVSKIEYTNTSIEVHTDQGVFHADKVIVTVPLSMLKNNSIIFSPSLPSEKINAIQKIGFGTGMKINLKFTTRFWDASLGSLITDGHVPEYWYTSAGRSEEPVLTAFVMGEKAIALRNLGSAKIQAILQDLDKYYGNKATTYYSDSIVMDWGTEPYIEGSYSYAATSDILSLRTALAIPVANKVHFAGEATHYKGHNSTVHGAIESAIRCVEEILV